MIWTLTVSCEKYEIFSFISSIMTKIVAPSVRSKFPVILIVVSLLNQHQMLVVHLDLLLSSYNSFWNNDNLVSNQLSNHHIDQLQFFECYCKLINYLLLAKQKKKKSINHNIIIFYFYSWKKILCVLFWPLFLKITEQKVYLIPGNLNQLSNLNISFAFLLTFLTDIYSN